MVQLDLWLSHAALQPGTLLYILLLGLVGLAVFLLIDFQRQGAFFRRLGEIIGREPMGELGVLPEPATAEQQRAAAARAIVHESAIVLADEPTGNLDSRSARDLMETLTLLNNLANVTIAMVTHDPFAASYCRRILFIRDGQLYNEIHRGESRQVFFQQILDVLSLIRGGAEEPVADRH